VRHALPEARRGTLVHADQDNIFVHLELFKTLERVMLQAGFCSTTAPAHTLASLLWPNSL
jgi:hypothetical protein